ncbi:MAG: GNAT family N-acetyltransferase [Candidatus Nanoarchaeia archaeon]
MPPNSLEDVFSVGKVFVVEHEDRVIAFSIVREDGKVATLRYNSSEYETRELQANALIYWEVIMHYLKEGYETFDLGGIDLHAKHRHGNDRFKIRWGDC